jgi:hypothetical protein
VPKNIQATFVGLYIPGEQISFRICSLDVLSFYIEGYPFLEVLGEIEGDPLSQIVLNAE